MKALLKEWSFLSFKKFKSHLFLIESIFTYKDRLFYLPLNPLL